MGANPTRLNEDTLRDLRAVQQTVHGILAQVTLFNTTVTTKAGSVTLFSLDALGSSIREIFVSFYLAADGAATFTPTWHKTRAGDLVTLTEEALPALAVIALPANARYYSYSLGELAQGLQGEFRVAQDNAGNATNVVDAFLVALMEI